MGLDNQIPNTTQHALPTKLQGPRAEFQSWGLGKLPDCQTQVGIDLLGMLWCSSQSSARAFPHPSLPSIITAFISMTTLEGPCLLHGRQSHRKLGQKTSGLRKIYFSVYITHFRGRTWSKDQWLPNFPLIEKQNITARKEEVHQEPVPVMLMQTWAYLVGKSERKFVKWKSDHCEHFFGVHRKKRKEIYSPVR